MNLTKNNRLTNLFLPLTAACLVVIVSLLILFGGQNVGLSDNGDFARVMKVNRLYSVGDGRHSFLCQQYYTMELDGVTLGEQLKSLFATTMEDELYSSPHFVFIKLSKLMNYVYNHFRGASLDQYNLAFLACLYLMVLAAAAWLIVRHLRVRTAGQQLLALFLFLFLFCDAGYLLYFQSFYGEALQYVSLMLAVGLWFRLYENPRRIGSWVLLFLSFYFFAGSKLANIPLAALLACCSLLLLLRRCGRTARLCVPAFCLVFLFSLVVLYQSIPKWMDNDTNYQAVFFGILKNSATPEQDLQELGIDTQYAPLANTHAYQVSYPIDIHSEAFQRDFYEKISKIDVMRFYLRHPFRLAEKMDTALMCSAYIRPPYLGNSPTQRMEHTTRGSGWSWLRVRSGFLYHSIFVFPILLLGTLALLWLLISSLRGKRPRERLPAYAALFGLCCCTWASWILPILGNGEADLAKHMFLFIHLADFMLVLGIFAALLLLPKAARWCKRNLALSSVTAGVLVLAICAGIFFQFARRPAKVVFGQYSGKPLYWEVVTEDATSKTLVCASAVADLPFDENGGNLWRTSSLRAWLGGAFLEEFSSEEQAKILPNAHRELLPQSHAELAQTGGRPHFWHFDPRKAADLIDGAYATITTDLVTLPGPELFDTISHKIKKDYWLLSPYGSNDEMEWLAKRDGFILFQDAKESAGVRPVIKIMK